MESGLFDPVEYAKMCIREKVDSLVQEEIVYATVDMEKLIQITNHSDTYLRQNFICTPEAKALNISPTKKALWKYPEIRDCWIKFCECNKTKKLKGGNDNEANHA